MARRKRDNKPSIPGIAPQEPDPAPDGASDAAPPPDPAAVPGAGSKPGEPVDPAAQQVKLERSVPGEKGFVPEVLDRTIIAIPLLKILEADKQASGPPPASMSLAATAKPSPGLHHVIIDLNLLYPDGGRKGARRRVEGLINQLVPGTPADPAKAEGIKVAKSALSEQYLFCRLSGDTIRKLVAMDSAEDDQDVPSPRRNAIYRIWPDFQVKGLINKSISTVKADAAHRSFAALGDRIVWAVIDSGIDGKHPHFAENENLVLDPALQHQDFTAIGTPQGDPLKDVYGHGSHVAGIIAGGQEASKQNPVKITWRRRDENGSVVRVQDTLTKPITGMAPRSKLLSLKVLDDDGDGEVSSIIAALEYIQEINGHGRRIQVHGVNLSVGYDYEPEWFACGQSPLCVEVNRLVKSGVVVVAAAGNSGYGQILPEFAGKMNSAGIELTINDPGNAELAITVGSTHRDMPHIYGVSYFSSKGPTGDGRYKPDLVAPGEKIISCWSAGDPKRPAGETYKEDSGTSMAAPHVSGVIAAFLSARPEYIGQAEEVKRIFLATATDLNRTPYFQGKGLVDLMRAIQSV